MTAEDWKEHKQDHLVSKAENRKSNTEKLEEFCVENKIDLQKRTDYHYSLHKNDIRVDVFPTRGKFHNVKTGKRGWCDKLEDLLKYFNQ